MADAVDLNGNPRVWRGKSSWTVDIGAYEYGSFPLKCVGVAEALGGAADLTWNSPPGDTYIVQSCADLSASEWNDEETIESQGELTTWTDSDSTSTRKFYRIGIR